MRREGFPMASTGPQTDEGRLRLSESARSYYDSLSEEQRRARMTRMQEGQKVYRERVRRALAATDISEKAASE